MDNEVKQYIGLISDLLNIKINNEVTYIDITNSILKISNPVEFLEYARKNFNNEKYQYQTGYQKFNSILNDFSSHKSYEVPYMLKASIGSYTDKLFSRLTTILDEIIYQKEAHTHKVVKFEETLKKNLDDVQYELVTQVAEEKELLHLARYAREELRNKILNIVHLKTMLKHYGSPAIEKPMNENVNILSELAKRS